MALEHIVLVFEADPAQLNSSEKCLLLAYANYTDAHGYCWPGVDRLMVMTGMSKSTLIRVRKALEGKNLLRHQRRTGKDGRSTTNLYRVNLEKLRSMRVGRRDYGDNVMELAFEDTSPETSSDQPMSHSGTPGSQIGTPQSQPGTPGGSNLVPPEYQSGTQSLTYPLEEPSVSGERQLGARGETDCLPEPSGNSGGERLLRSLSWPRVGADPETVSPQVIRQHSSAVQALLDAGWAYDRLHARLARECDGDGAKDRMAVLVYQIRALGKVPVERAAGPGQTATTPVPPPASVVLSQLGRNPASEQVKSRYRTGWRDLKLTVEYSSM